MNDWTLTGLYQAMQKDLDSCTTDFERSMCKIVCEKEIRRKAIEFKKIRKLTPGEESVLANINSNYKS